MTATALTIDGLEVSFGSVKAVNNVTMAIAEGELRVLLGANGAGKTTLMDLISGRTHSTSGHVHLYDTEITNWQEHRIARAGIGRKFQIPSVFRELTVRQNFEVASCRNPSVFANLGFGFSRHAQARIEEVLAIVDLRDKSDVTAAYLSHGQTQWLELGLLMLQDPKVILLDEPTAGHDPGRDAKDRRHHQQHARAGTPCSSSNTTWRSCARSPNASPCCISARCWRKATLHRYRNATRSSRARPISDRGGIS